MKWFNESLELEEIWFKKIREIQQELEKEVAENLAKLEVDENGVLHEQHITHPILFDRLNAMDKMEEVGKKLMTATVMYYGKLGSEVKND